MKLAVVGSRSIKEINIERYVGGDVDEIVSGGAVGVDSCAAEYARSKKIKLTEFHQRRIVVSLRLRKTRLASLFALVGFAASKNVV